ncbi:hypothetical protein PybrP1_005462 [[Pythium] brassicae (nom. inval.)]|nr:hypothetical protein PybrP1_005462 [[Pythium] brassicae (nom. inval.)]
MVIGFDTPEPEPLSAARCPLTASLYDEAVGRNIVTDATCAGGGVGCVLKNCRYCRVHPTAVSQAYVSCSGFEPAATLTPTSSSGGSRPPTSPSANVVETPDTNFCSASLVDASQASAGVWAFVDEDGCAGDPANCQLGVCRFCKFTESPASSAYGACPDQGSESRWLIAYAGSSV